MGPAGIAFNTDITPTLYYLLDHRPILNLEPPGRPLFTFTVEEQVAYSRPNYLVASSYAPVYGILDRNGDDLYIADAVNRRNYFYNLTADSRGAHNAVTPQIRDRYERLIEDRIGNLHRYYGVRPF